MTSWIYIVGRGHSGTTMLDAMLGNSNYIESVGELVSGMGRYTARCSCGDTFAECAYWKKVRQRFAQSSDISWEEAGRYIVRQAYLKLLFKTFFSSSESAETKIRKVCSIRIAEALEEESGKRVIVDSSKEFTRSLFLIRFLPGTKVIHLVRHPEGVLGSHLRRLSDGKGFKMLRRRFQPRKWFAPLVFLGAAGWIIGNLLAECLKVFGDAKVLRVRYEDLIDCPYEELGRIESFLGYPLEDLKKIVVDKSQFNIGHNIGGKHMRLKKGFAIEKRGSYSPRLPKKYLILINFLCWPLIWRYGYYKK